MFTCKRAKEVWHALGLEEVIENAIKLDRSGSVIFEEILRNPCKKSPVIGQLGLQETIVVAAWYIWWQRREAVKGEKIAPVTRTAFSIQALTLNYKQATRSAPPRQVQWCKPPPNHYKVNIDATFFPNGMGAAAAVIRNDHGELVSGGAWPKLNLIDATTAEAEALRHGLLLAEKIGCSPVIIESDSLEIIEACNGTSDLWSPYTAILADCFQISQGIGMIKFQHCSREVNKVAHNLARLSFDSDSIISWDGDPPSSVLQDVMNDVSMLSII